MHVRQPSEVRMSERIEPWERVGVRTAGDYEAFTVREDRSRSPVDGTVHSFHVVEVPRCVQIIAVTEDGRFVMVEQYRHAVRQVTMEFPAGRMDAGETDVAAALRELREETGYEAADAEVLAEIWPDPATLTNTVAIVLATGCRPVQARDLDETEDVAVRVFSRPEVERMLTDGTIRGAQAMAVWFLYTSSGRSAAAAAASE
jgi:ADP-ribose pyrophosphatase